MLTIITLFFFERDLTDTELEFGVFCVVGTHICVYSSFNIILNVLYTFCRESSLHFPTIRTLPVLNIMKDIFENLSAFSVDGC